MNQLSIEDYIKTARYEGPVNAADCARLEGQTRRIFDLMVDEKWRTLAEIESITGYPVVTNPWKIAKQQTASFISTGWARV
mgnify:CR=1 FL=1